MTHRTTPPPRICPNCDGHASAAITLGGRDTQGNRRTITAYCPACHGTGTTHRRTRSSREGARA
ncbi:hypothetical protein SALBM311S_09145 [Streptomyces alboniger]